MLRQSFLTLASTTIIGLAGSFFSSALAGPAGRIGGPVVHENLAIYFIRGQSQPGPVPLTLAEALTGKLVQVHETGQVSQLSIENLGDQEVFVQAGDIVKGGQQDRVLTVSLVLPPRSGRVPIGSFCVEQGRWSGRPGEDVKTFTTAPAALPSREAKLRIAGTPSVPVPGIAPAVPSVNPQQGVWNAVAEVQQKLSRTLGAPVASPRSQTSLQLSLENEKLKEAQRAYVTALQAAGEQDDIVGYVFAINGKLNSADVYPSNGLFRKMWPKLLLASATEALGEKGKATGEPPAIGAVSAFLAAAEAGKADERKLNAHAQLERRDGDKALYVSAARPDGRFVHRNYLAK